jgi:hypothetical protein
VIIYKKQCGELKASIGVNTAVVSFSADASAFSSPKELRTHRIGIVERLQITQTHSVFSTGRH